jgi:hypothetical protein
MKKLFYKDKNLRFNIKKFNKKYYILKSILKNNYLFFKIKQNANKIIGYLSYVFRVTSIINRCIYTISKKRFNKFTLFSRFIFLKFIRNGLVNGFRKHNW